LRKLFFLNGLADFGATGRDGGVKSADAKKEPAAGAGALSVGGLIAPAMPE